MKFAVEQRYYDSGKVDVHMRQVEDSFQAVCNLNIEAYDLWIDTFDSECDTENFLQECLEA